MPSLNFLAYPALNPATISQLGPTVVIAPHPDDESLGCGGLIAMLRQAGVPVWCVLVTDGTMSHPGSRKYPPAARQALREQELRQALAELGVLDDMLLTLNLPDGAVPAPTTEAGTTAVQRLAHFLQHCAPQTILAPWRRDPHPDHCATSLLVREAWQHLQDPPRLLEYMVWAWERATEADLPLPEEGQGWQLDIRNVLFQKQQAIAAHRSQLPDSPINDDPTGFTLSPAMLEHFVQPVEVFWEASSYTTSPLPFNTHVTTES